eukprot:TRINITY_DN14955_c0_g1_i1.p2 TRINITY_DN14955_c0_g1~~TRINITY_DN14955_c0_g1_i1.p2  ORF type:complete len:126 (+),score=5.57 TRINITY_DN14955_c0_g1_i1:579-956(+)
MHAVNALVAMEYQQKRDVCGQKLTTMYSRGTASGVLVSVATSKRMKERVNVSAATAYKQTGAVNRPALSKHAGVAFFQSVWLAWSLGNDESARRQHLGADCAEADLNHSQPRCRATLAHVTSCIA